MIRIGVSGGEAGSRACDPPHFTCYRRRMPRKVSLRGFFPTFHVVPPDVERLAQALFERLLMIRGKCSRLGSAHGIRNEIHASEQQNRKKTFTSAGSRKRLCNHFLSPVRLPLPLPG